MKTISASLANTLKKDGLIERDYIIFKDDVEQKKHYMWFKLYDDCYENGNFIGTFILKRIEIEYDDNNITFKNKEFKAYKEFKIGENEWESIDYGSFIVTDINPSDTKETTKVTAYDYGLKFTNEYSSELNYDNQEITLLDVFKEICSKCGVETDMTEFTNSSFIVDSNQFKDGQSYGNVIAQIAAISGNFGKIENDKVVLKFATQTNIIIEDYEEFKDKRNTQPFTTVILDVSNIEGEEVIKKDDALIQRYGEHKLQISDNLFAYTEGKRNQLINNIFSKIKGFNYSSTTIKNTLYPQLECGDLIKIKNSQGELVDSIVLRITYEEDEITLEAPSVISATITYETPESVENKLKRTEITVNKQTQEINSVVKNVNTQNEKISETLQTVNELSAKISDVADITVTGESIYANISLDNINESEPIKIIVRPVEYDISYLYPRNNLYPSNELFSKSRILRFENTRTNEVIDYELPLDLLYYDSSNYDEFNLDYNLQTCTITKKIGYNADGTKYILDNSEELTFEYPSIILKDGDYKISIAGHSQGYIYVRLMASNIYTTQFATKVELKSAITQTSEEITLEVERTIKAETKPDVISSKISQSAEKILLEGNRIEIISDNFHLEDDGSITATNGSFSGNIYLTTGGKIMSETGGILTNLVYPGFVRGAMFTGSGDFLPLGHVGMQVGNTSYGHGSQTNEMSIVFKLPSDFTPISAKIHLIHSPITWYTDDGTYTGYSRNLVLYKSTSGSMGIDLSSYNGAFSSNKTLLSNALNFTGSSYSVTYGESIELVNNLSSDYNNFIIKSKDGALTGNSVLEHTGGVMSYMEIIGYKATRE